MIEGKWLRIARELTNESKSYRRFFNAMKTDSTITSYAYSMNRFMNFLKEEKYIKDTENYDYLIEFDTEKITDVLEEFVYHLNKTQKTTSVNTILSSPELFFEMNRKIWHRKLVRKSIKKDGKQAGGKLPIPTNEVEILLDNAKHPRDKALIHFLASTGSRPSGIHDPILRMKHLMYMPNPNNPTKEHHWCYAVKIYDESKEGYWSFLTPEATLVLNRYFGWRKQIRHEEINDESPVFGNISKRSKESHLGIRGMNQLIWNLIDRTEIKRVKTGYRFDKAQNYMFRKRFNIILKLNNDVNSNIAEKLMAHKRGLDGTYLQPTQEECYREFVKAIPELTVSSQERQKIEIEMKQETIDTLEATALEKDNLEKKVDIQDNRIADLERRLFEKEFKPITKN